MAVVEVTVVPIGSEGPSLSEYVSKALEELEDTDLKYELTSSGTILQGDLDEVLAVAKRMHESVFDQEISRVVTYLQIDDRRDKSLTIRGKKESVEKKMKDST
ncbi:hypothetical protein AKJ65_01785 [candidate division MSBL1 archaeon SCGC-AAA259E19]|uniref:Thiamine-binding protein domain-containing protein n=1 Tax=candidate division MSBL1 archaeon SCGC-AAA259E19 TaxID=1698264 RepID=A0A133UMS9_9EURY|nr:hypothetical protein AKJ65_01785 [candidate division MSBL1 archaeon SCGC-AAA259E19]